MTSSRAPENSEDLVGLALSLKAMAGILGGYVAFYAAYGLIVIGTAGTSEAAGLFGDAYGGFNAFVSGLAMLGVVTAIWLQHEQIRMQALELRLQREELQLQRAE